MAAALSDCTSTMLVDPPLQAKFIVEELNITCPLTVTRSADNQIETTGSCPNVPVSKVPGEKRTLKIEWFVVSPTAKKEIMIGEIHAQADLSEDEVDMMTEKIDFDAEVKKGKRSVYPKAKRTQTDADKDRFNCDRHGQLGAGETPCDSTKPVTQSIGDKDNCSNLEELCKGTLFNATDELNCPD